MTGCTYPPDSFGLVAGIASSCARRRFSGRRQDDHDRHSLVALQVRGELPVSVAQHCELSAECSAASLSCQQEVIELPKPYQFR